MNTAEFSNLVAEIEDFFAESDWEVTRENAGEIAWQLDMLGYKKLGDVKVRDLQKVVLDVIG